MNSKNPVYKNAGMWGVIMVVVAVGAVMTVKDYRQWKNAETMKYGQGWKDLSKPPMILEKLYSNKLTGIRLRVPQEWRIEEKSGADGNVNLKWDQVVKSGQRMEVATVNDQMTVEIMNKEVNLSDEVAAQMSRLSGLGMVVDKDVTYVNSDKFNLTVITYTEELPGGKANMRQDAYGMKANKLIKLSVTVPEESWGDVKNTYGEIYKSVEII